MIRTPAIIRSRLSRIIPSGASVIAPPSGYLIAIDPHDPSTLRDAAGNPLTSSSYGVSVADIHGYNAGGVKASQVTGSLRGKYYCPDNGVGFLMLPGVAGNFASVPASADDDFGTGDFSITVRLKGLSLSAGVKTLVMNRSGATGFDFQVSTATPRIVINGATIHTATAALASSPEWIRVRRVSTVFKFETSPDGTTWTQLGTDVNVTASPTASGGQLQIGQYTTGQNLNARVYRVVVNKAGNDGIVIDFTNSSVPHGADSFTATTGQTVTINRSGADSACLIRGGVICLDGVDDFYTLASTIAVGSTPTFGDALAVHGAQAFTFGPSASTYPTSNYASTATLFANSEARWAQWSATRGRQLQALVSVPKLTSPLLEINGVDAGAATGGSAHTVGTPLATIGKQNTTFSSGQFGRAAVYDRELTSTERRQLAQWLAEPYGITIP